MPHAISPHDSQEELDDLLIQQALDPENPIDFNRELEPGEKADDAIDFGDLSDDDLADDEDEGKTQAPTHEVSDTDNAFEGLETFIEEGPHFTSSEGPAKDEFDDLFGDMPSSPLGDGNEPKQSQLSIESAGLGGASDLEVDDPTQDTDGDLLEAPGIRAQGSPELRSQSIFRPITFDGKESLLSKEQRLQEELFAMSRHGLGGSDNLPPPPENPEELLISLWPKFRRDTVLNFMDLLPPKKTRYVARKPLKRPKQVQPTKVSLELAQDQEKSFRLSVTNRRIQEDMERAGVIAITNTTPVEKASDEDEDIESDYEHEPVGGISWQDLQIACEDWDIHDQAESLPRERTNVPGRYESVIEEYSQDDLYQSDNPPAKVRVSKRSNGRL